MFACFQDARTAFSGPLRASAVRTRARAAVASQSRFVGYAPPVRLDMLTPHGETAEKLNDIGLWLPTRGRRTKKGPTADKNRINITSEGLCDDIMKYLAPSLQRHRGCDLVDINPGAGVWSRKLHEVVQPRKHIMMEKDAELYAPFLQDLTAQDNVVFIPKSGIVWKDLTVMLREHLKGQAEMSQALAPDAAPERNDTLLISVNLSMYPPKSFQLFDCVSTMVMYQFMSSIRTASLFQRYGLVRMLIWVNDDGKRKLLPRSVVRRKRSAFEASLSCEWIHEIAGKDVEIENRNELRDEWINMESGYQTLRRMEAAGLTPPPGRETYTYRNLTAQPELAGKRLAGVEQPRLERPFRAELEEIEAEYNARPTPDLLARLKKLRFRQKYDHEDSSTYLALIQEREALSLLPPDSPEFIQGDAAWSRKILDLKKNTRKEFVMVRDNYHLFRQSPPSLLWDQRPYEPLAVHPEDFFPNIPCTLLDFQPKAMHPLLRQTGPTTSRAGDMSDIMLRFWFAHSLLPASKAMDGVWPGFGQLYDQCPSLRDTARGGSPLSGQGEVCARALNPQQWEEVLEAFVDWPFRPSYAQLVGRLVDDHEHDDVDDESKTSAQGAPGTS